MVQTVESSEPNRVADFFAEKTILITGGSGFLGKVLLEKLLRSCTHLKKIYVLMRPKKGRSPDERLQEIVDGLLFDVLKKEQGKGIFDKVEVITGNIECVDLGISPQDRKRLVEEVEIIYHSAATVQFDDSFKKSVLLNVRGTKLMLALAKECKNLVAYCHLSTAYCQETQKVLYEKTYPPPADPHRVINMCEWMDEHALECIANKIRGNSANTYTFTKALGEGLVTEQMDQLPIIIQRPSAVVPIWREPLPGWTDNINGPIGILLGGGKGVIRTMYGNPEYFADYASVDCVASALICTTYDYVTHKTRRVYNLTAADEVKITFQQIVDVGTRIATTQVPFDLTLWYPSVTFTNNRALHIFLFIFFQLIPAFFMDAFLYVFGFKPFLLRVQKKVLRGYKVLEYYSNSKWDFRKDNVNICRSLLNEREKRTFKLDSEGFEFTKYFTDCALGLRRYLLKDKDENIPMALRRMKILWFVDRAYKILLFSGLLYLMYRITIAPYL